MHDNFVLAVLDFFKSPWRNYRKYRSLYTFEHADSDRRGDSNDYASDIIWALRDVSFEVKRAEVLGIIGRNGAGKSTVLKILSRITHPTSGRAVIHGRVSSLLEVGTGFHQELTGRENVYLNGTVLGMSKKEVDRKFDEIVDFSEIEKFIDTPVKRYSSGMKVRLAFSVAAHLDPEILIIDEVLAVGDAQFQRKCLGKMHEASDSGRTVLFVSHNMAAISHLCSRVLVLESGKIRVDDTPDKAIAAYLNDLSPVSDNHELASLPRSSGMIPIIQKLDFLDHSRQSISAVPTGGHLTIVIHYMHSDNLLDPYFGLRFETIEGVPIFLLQTRAQKGHLPDLPSAGTITCHIPRFALAPGTYFISIGCGSRETQLDYVRRGCRLQVVEADVFGTGRLTNPGRELVIVDADWELEPKMKRVSQPIHEITR